jgi:hypothetical protein
MIISALMPHQMADAPVAVRLQPQRHHVASSRTLRLGAGAADHAAAVVGRGRIATDPPRAHLVDATLDRRIGIR